MESNRVSVKIYGQEYVIAGEKSRDHIIKVADHVNTKMHEIAQIPFNGPVSSLAVLSAVNIADEYFDVLLRLKEQKQMSDQKEKDTEHYIQLWDEAKKNFIQFKEEAAGLTEQREQLRRLVSAKDSEIEELYKELEKAEEKGKALAEEKTAELETKCRELESGFFELQMENIQLKSELERFKRTQNNF